MISCEAGSGIHGGSRGAGIKKESQLFEPTLLNFWSGKRDSKTARNRL